MIHTTHVLYPDLHARLSKLRFYDIGKIGRDIRGQSIGIDANRKFKDGAGGEGGTKKAFAKWLLAQDWLYVAQLEALLPAYEESARQYYTTKGERGTAKPRTPRIYTAATVVDDVPKPTASDELDRVRKEHDKQEASEAQDAPPVTVPKDMADIIRQVLERAKHEANGMDTARAKEYVAGMLVFAQGFNEAVAAQDAKLKEAMERMALARPILVTVQNGDTLTTTSLGAQHFLFNDLLKLCASCDARGNRFNVWITGPAGSGKTTAAENVSKALAVPFHFTGAVDNEYKLLGFTDANGKTVRTAFREAYENGGIFLLDEVDGCHPGALLALNAALANAHCDFPDGTVTRHKDCVIIAAANTWGTGATHEYVGRTKLDDASLDRFKMLPWAYDEALERNASGNVAWATKVQAIRAKIAEQGIKHIVSPRATYDGAAMLAQGWPEPKVAAMVMRKGLNDTQWANITRGIL